MKGYTIFFEKYHQTSDKTQREQLMHTFMFRLSPDELVTFLSDNNKALKDNLSELIQSGNASNIQFAKDCLDDLDSFLQPHPVRKAA
jgi:hypothetical protein